jgi:CheY-like chemotaxis protein
VEAIEQARRHRPDVVLMDVSMPVMDGLEAARRLRAEAEDLRIIALTADGGTEISKRVKDAGCDYFLRKPVSPDDLLTHIDRVLGW